MSSDPQKFDHKEIMEHLKEIPQVRGYRILLIPVDYEEKTAGGIIIPDDVREKQKNHALVFRVVAMGAEAYKDRDRFPSGPYCEPGDYVLIARYAGTRISTLYCEDLRVVNDDEIMAVVPEYQTTMNLV